MSQWQRSSLACSRIQRGVEWNAHSSVSNSNGCLYMENRWEGLGEVPGKLERKGESRGIWANIVRLTLMAHVDMVGVETGAFDDKIFAFLSLVSIREVLTIYTHHSPSFITNWHNYCHFSWFLMTSIRLCISYHAASFQIIWDFMPMTFLLAVLLKVNTISFFSSFFISISC